MTRSADFSIVHIINRTADETEEIKIDKKSVARVVQWYAAFCAGDDYSIYINGREMRLDHNGELEEVVIDMPSMALARRA